MSHKNTAEAKDRPISEKQWSTDTSPQFTESSTITSHHSHSHLTGVTLFPKVSRQTQQMICTSTSHCCTAAYHLPWYADLSQASELHSHQSCPLVYICWLLLIFLSDYMDTSQFCEQPSPAELQLPDSSDQAMGYYGLHILNTTVSLYLE